MRKISINLQGGLLFCVALLCAGKSGSAELLGSSNPEIRRNFNQLLTTNACRGCNLNGAVLNRLNLTEADLEGADLTGARLNAASLVGANLRNAVLRGAWLGDADLTKANLLGADLEGADFTLDGRAPVESLGQQATASAQHTVNTTLDDLFATRQEPPAATDEKRTAGSVPTPPKEVSIFFAPLEPAPPSQEQQNVDDILVIETTSTPAKEKIDDTRLWGFLFDMQKKKAAPAEPANKMLSEPVKAIVLEQGAGQPTVQQPLKAANPAPGSSEASAAVIPLKN
jgi:hypothetical protein